MQELRATTSLGRPLRAMGRGNEARNLLAPIYAAFTEGFSTPDLLAAKTVLEKLG
jgi:predicted ATPase